jgi:hypothetical protein
MSSQHPNVFIMDFDYALLFNLFRSYDAEAGYAFINEYPIKNIIFCT